MKLRLFQGQVSGGSFYGPGSMLLEVTLNIYKFYFKVVALKSDVGSNYSLGPVVSGQHVVLLYYVLYITLIMCIYTTQVITLFFLHMPVFLILTRPTRRVLLSIYQHICYSEFV